MESEINEATVTQAEVRRPTTMDLPESMLEALKVLAFRRKTSMRAVVEESLRQYLEQQQQQ